MFSRIRNHEKLVENGENPSVVAKKLKEGTHERDSDPKRILGKRENTETAENTETKEIEEGKEKEAVKGKGKGKHGIIELITKDPEVENEGEKKGGKRAKNGSRDFDYNVSEIVDLHSYKEPVKTGKGKGKGKGKGQEPERVKEEETWEGENRA
jgi:hypothetical protein